VGGTTPPAGRKRGKGSDTFGSGVGREDVQSDEGKKKRGGNWSFDE